MGNIRRISKFATLAICLVVAHVTRFWLARTSLAAPSLVSTSLLFTSVSRNTLALVIAEVASLFLLFTSAFILNASLFNTFLLLLTRIVFQKPSIDMVSTLVNFNFSLVAITVVLMPTRFPITVLVALSGIVTALGTVMTVELFALGLFAFFSLLFFWLRNHRIGNDDASAAPDAMKTVVVFMLCFGAGFFCFGRAFGFPSVSKEIWSAASTVHVLPILQSKLAMAAFPAFFPHHEPQKLLLAFTCVLSAEFFRFIPLATEGAGFSMATAVSARLMDIGAVVFISGSSSRFTGVFSLAIVVTLYITSYFIRI